MQSLFLPPSPPLPSVTPNPQMQSLFLPYNENAFHDSSAATRSLNSAAAQRDARLAAAFHAAAFKSGVHVNPFVGNSILHAYSACGRLDFARNLFDKMPHRDVVSWTTLISAHSRNGSAESAFSIFSDMLSDVDSVDPNEFTLAAVLQACSLLRDEGTIRMVHGYLAASGFIGDRFVSNSLIDGYAKCGLIMDAEKVVRGSGCRDVVSWTAVISGCVLHLMMDKALVLFIEMLNDRIVPNVVTMLSVIQACSLMGEPFLFDWVHAWVVKLELVNDVLITNSLIEMYSKNGLVDEGMKVLFQFCLLNGNAWFESFEPDVMATLVQGCTRSGSFRWSELIHGFVIKLGLHSFAIVENSLMDMYGKQSLVDSAHSIFMRMENRDIVSWNTMISCFVKNGHAFEALELLTEIHSRNGDESVPDAITALSAVQACSELASLQQGRILHGHLIRSGFSGDVFICNALIDMYSKSGRIDLAVQIFNEMDARDLSSWNSMIAAYGIHGDGNSALRVFTDLKKLGKDRPNAVTFINAISACSHSGLATEGYECFLSMRRDYGIEPNSEHYASIVGLLGRIGNLEEALDFIESMPVDPGLDVWGSLLGACGIHGNVEIAEIAAEKLAVLEPDGIIWKVALANVYALAGRWGDASALRAQMRRKGSRKEAGWSFVEVNGGENFKFMVADTRHPDTSRIYEVWDTIREHIVDAVV